MKQFFTLAFILTTVYLSAQTLLPKYSIGTDISSSLEFRKTIWFNQQYLIAPSDGLGEPVRYKSIILDFGYIVGQAKFHDESLDKNKISFKLRTGINFYKKKNKNLYIYQGILLGVKSVQFSKFDDLVVPEELDSLTNLTSPFLRLLTPTTTIKMLREGSMHQYSFQYTLGFEWFISRRISIQSSYHLGIKYKEFKLTRGQEDYFNLEPITIFDDFKNRNYYGIDIDMALKLNFFLF